MRAASPVSIRRNIVANYLSRGWSAAMGLAFIPVYTHYMGVEAMGVVGLFVTLQAICMILDAGLSTTLNRELARLALTADYSEDSRREMRDLVCTFSAFFWIAALIGGTVVSALAPFIARSWVHVQFLSVSSVEASIRLMGLVLFFQLPLSLYSGGLLGLQRQVEYGILNAAWYTLRFAGAVVVLRVFGPNLNVFFLWQVAVAIFGTGLTALVLSRLLPATTRSARFRISLFENRWQFAAGLGGISITLLVLNNVDKVTLSRIVTLQTFGYYTLAYTLANSVRLLADPIFVTFFPRLSQACTLGDEVKTADLYHKVCATMSAAIIPFSLTLVFFAPEALMLWTRSPEIVANTANPTRLLAIGNLCLGLTIGPYALQLATGWTSLALWSNILASVVLIPLMLTIAPRYGTVGAGAAWTVLNATYLLGTVAVMHRRLLRTEGWRWAFGDVGKTLLVVVCVLLPIRLLTPGTEGIVGSLTVLALGFGLSEICAVAASPLSCSARQRVFQVLRGGEIA